MSLEDNIYEGLWTALYLIYKNYTHYIMYKKLIELKTPDVAENGLKSYLSKSVMKPNFFMSLINKR